MPGAGSSRYHPFSDWDFLHALETTDCVGTHTGWTPAHIWLEDENGAPAGTMPLYIKSHSMGEYVFDQGWADGAQSAGLSYYPKLQCAVPFTPASGPRLIAGNRDAKQALVQAAQKLCQDSDISSIHVTFCQTEDQQILEQNGFLRRTDRQFHFINRGYKNFEDFLSQLTARKRKKIKSERKHAQEHVRISRLCGDDIKPEHWDAFYGFYIDTAQRKWGRPYLTRAFFEALHTSFRDHVLLILAYEENTIIAGALNFIGGDALYGRHWGASKHIPFLHFELCYYQAIEAAIALKLSRVEAGAQGEHKLARGYEPIETSSAHYLKHEGLHGAVEQFLKHERRAVDGHIHMLEQYSPFKKGSGNEP